MPHSRHRHPTTGLPPHIAMRHGWLSVFVHDLEYNPDTQYRVHLYATYFWVVNIVLVAIAQFIFPDQWREVAVFYLAIISVYSNVATDYGAMSAASAAKHDPPLPEIPLEPYQP